MEIKETVMLKINYRSIWKHFLTVVIIFSAILAVYSFLQNAKHRDALRDAQENWRRFQSESFDYDSFKHKGVLPGAVSEPHPSHSDVGGADLRSPGEVAIVDDWMKSSGFSPFPAAYYGQQYTEEQLIVLSEAGDFIATDALLNICLREGCDTDKKIELAKRGIVQGSLRAISSLSIYSGAGLYFGEPLSDAEAKQKLTDVLAYQYLLDLRGVGEAKPVDRLIKHEMEMFSEFYPHLVPLSDADEESIKQRAQSLYDEYQEARYQLGLGDFNNEMPPEAKKFFGIL